MYVFDFIFTLNSNLNLPRQVDLDLFCIPCLIFNPLLNKWGLGSEKSF